MAKLKGVIFGVENVLIKRGNLAPHTETLEATGKLMRFLRKQGVESVVMTNREWGWTHNGIQTPLQQAIENRWNVKLNWFQCAKGGVPAKQTADSIKYVRESRGWTANETLFIGNTDNDMRASVNGKILLLNAEWYAKTMEYGFHFDCPKEVARFIDTFCFREHFWYFKIDDGPLQVYSLAPFSTMFGDETKYYSENFIWNVKNGFAQDEEFWAKMLATSMYFSGIYESVDYVAAYPKHEAGKYQKLLLLPMTTFAKCFRKDYIADLIHRHTTALKSQHYRKDVNHQTQLDTIHLCQFPHKLVKGEMRQYAKCPIVPGKTVLVIDDVCTKGMSFEAARHYLMKAGAKVICVSFLKALKHSYESLSQVPLASAFAPNTIKEVTPEKTYSLALHVVDKQAQTELHDRLQRYQKWDWPTDV